MTQLGRVFLAAGIALIVLEIALVFALQPAQWISVDLVGMYSEGRIPGSTVIFAIITVFAAGSLLASAVKRIGDPTRDFHRRHKDERMARWRVANGIAATAGGIILAFALANVFVFFGFFAYLEWPAAMPIGGGLETLLGNMLLGALLVLAGGVSAIAQLVAQVNARRAPV